MVLFLKIFRLCAEQKIKFDNNKRRIFLLLRLYNKSIYNMYIKIFKALTICEFNNLLISHQSYMQCIACRRMRFRVISHRINLYK